MRMVQAIRPQNPAATGQTIKTRRLVLRPQQLSDAGSIAEALSDFQVARMLTRIPAPYHRQDALEWLVMRTAGTAQGWDFAITRADDTLIGVVCVEERDGEWQLGYWLNRAHWGKGYMTEAVSAVTERFFQHMPDETLYSGVFADNAASLRVQEKLGFRVVGCHEIYAASRSTMVTHIDTAVTAQTFRPSQA